MVVEIRLGANDLHGQLPTELGLLSNLQSLDLSDNLISGLIIPSELGRLTRLQGLELCNFATIYSSELDTVISLVSFSQLISSTVVVVGNQLAGPIPSKLGRLTRLKHFDRCKFATISSSELDTITLFGSVL
jgi:Leucine-rich repeat (LRR) protein